MDCTFCLDCVQACPYDNVGIVARLPGSELVDDPRRSGIGRFGERPDVLALAMVVVFAAFVNAAGMIGPVLELQDGIARVLGAGSERLAWSVFLVLGLGVVPVALLAGTAAVSRWLSRDDVPAGRILLRMGFGLVPLGFGMWLAHYAFHFLASGLNLVPVLHRVGIDAGILGGAPDWSVAALVPAGWLLPLELLVLEAGLLASLVLLHSIARATFRSRRHARRAFAPWAVLALGLGATGGWIMAQPMAMRGMMMPGMPGMEMDTEMNMEHDGMMPMRGDDGNG
jgi:hypothetical protein